MTSSTIKSQANIQTIGHLQIYEGGLLVRTTGLALTTPVLQDRPLRLRREIGRMMATDPASPRLSPEGREYQAMMRYRLGLEITDALAERVVAVSEHQKLITAVAYRAAIETQRMVFRRFIRYLFVTTMIGTLYLYWYESAVLLVGGGAFLTFYAVWWYTKLQGSDARNTLQRWERP